jgi:carbon monoxide dehydrogenase subunit G
MLKLTGQVTVNRPPADLWKLLMDPSVLKKCIPKCEDFEEIGPFRYRVALKVGFGLVRGHFKGEAELKDVVELETYRLEVHAKGSTGFVEGATCVRLAAVNGGQQTALHYESDAHVGGMLASVGARLFQGAARSFADQFFDEISKL